MTPAAWGLLAGLIGLAGYVPYLRDAWRRASDPDPAAWLIWTVEYAVLLAAQAAQHPPWAALWLAALQLAGTVAVFALLAARGGWHFSAGRWAMLGGGAAVMAVWPFAHAPGAAMCLALAVEGAGMALVMLNAYRRPGSETLLTWWAFVAAGLVDLPALGTHAPRFLYAYPVFFIVMGTGVLMAAARGARAAAVSAQRQRDLPWDRQRSGLPVQAARQPRGGNVPENTAGALASRTRVSAAPGQPQRLAVRARPGGQRPRRPADPGEESAGSGRPATVLSPAWDKWYRCGGPDT
jgi:hypothetical protein